jgi:hypothetical protein
MQLQSTFTPQDAQLRARPLSQLRMQSFAIATAFVALTGLGLSRPLAASNGQESQASATPRACTLATLQGRYLFAESGVLLPPAFGVAIPTQAADVGFHIFNGDGTGTDIVTVRIGSTVVLENLVSPLVYTVNPDCTGTITVSNGPSFDIFVAPDGSEFGSIATAPAGNYPASIVVRVSKR